MIALIIAVLVIYAVAGVVIARLIRLCRALDQRLAPTAWFDEERFRHGLPDGDRRIAGVVDRVRAARGVITHPCSYGGELIEYPLHDGFAEDAVLDTLAEIEAL